MIIDMDPLESLQARILTGDKADYLRDTWKLSDGREAWARLYAVVAGEGIARHHGQTFTLRPGRLYLIPPESGLDLGTPSKVTIWWVHATLLVGGVLDFFRMVAPRYEIADDAAGSLSEMTGDMVDRWREGTLSSRLKAHGILMNLLSRFLPEEGVSPEQHLTADWKRFLPALHRMRDAGERSPTVAELARLTGMTRGHFSLRFHELVGMPPVKYLARSRVERVKALLRAPEPAGLEALARSCGFHDAFHLSKTFKRVAGVSPKAYRLSVGKRTMA